MRPIDADELITRIESYIERKAITEKDAKIFELICDLINTAPTVEYPFYQEAYQTGYEEGYLKGVKVGNDQKRKICDSCKIYERPHGEWLEHYSKEMNEKGYFICSRCKCGFQRFERGIRHSDLPWIDGQKYELHCIDNFCPNCGADMQKGGAE